MSNGSYSRYGGSVDMLVREFVLSLKHTFGEEIFYVGTTTDLAGNLNRIRDIDVMAVLSKLSDESHVSHVWRITNKLRLKYNIFFDVRLYSKVELTDQTKIPLVNLYLLKTFLQDLLGENPFKEIQVKPDELNIQCKTRIREQESKIISILPRIQGDPSQIRAIAQCVFDAIRAFLILECHPLASKESANDYFIETFPEFEETTAIYNAYLDPNSIVNISNFVLDCLGIVKHLFHKSQKKTLCKEVLLINTPSSTIPHPRTDYLSYDHNMPLGLVCLGSYLITKGVPVNILDAYAENLGALSMIDRIFGRASIPKIIGLNSCSPNIHVVHRIASNIKRVNKDIIIVCGGPHASLAIEHTLSTGDIDFVIVGEGEQPLLNLVESVLSDAHFKITDIPGVYGKDSGKIVGQENHEHFDLSKIPTPEFNLLPIERYFNVKKRLYIHTSRGCAFNCIYCSVPKCWGRRVRQIPAKLLIDQLEELLSKYGPNEVQIVDDNFSHKKGKMIREFCDGIISRNLKFGWKCQVRADQLDDNIIKLMADTGCFEIDLGIESGNDEVQKYIRKNLNLNKTIDIISAIHKYSIFAKAFFMVGFPTESYNHISDTINYAVRSKKVGLGDVAFFPVMPFPGTEISDSTGRKVYQGAIIDNFDIHERTFATERLRKYSAKPEVSLNTLFTPDDLRLLVKFSYQRFQLGVPVANLYEEFNEYKTTEQAYIYGI